MKLECLKSIFSKAQQLICIIIFFLKFSLITLKKIQSNFLLGFSVLFRSAKPKIFRGHSLKFLTLYWTFWWIQFRFAIRRERWVARIASASYRTRFWWRFWACWACWKNGKNERAFSAMEEDVEEDPKFRFFLREAEIRV